MRHLLAFSRPSAAALACALPLACLLLLCAAACTSDSSGDHLPSHDAGPQDSLTKDRAKFFAACMEKNAIPVSWGADTAFGVPAGLFASLAGTCAAPLKWNAGSLERHLLTPTSGQSGMTVMLSIDQSSTRLVQPATEPFGTGHCDGVLLVDGRVTLTSTDGVFSESGPITVRYTQALGLQPVTFSVDVPKQHGSVAIALADGETGRLTFTFDGAASAAFCTGEIELATAYASDGGASGSSSTFGSWSSTGCGLGTTLFDATKRATKADASVSEVVAKAWGDATLSGTWDDDKKTSLTLHAALAPVTSGEKPICFLRQQHSGTLPVLVNYGTADGRIKPYDTKGSIDAQLSATGEIQSLELYVYDYLACHSAKDVGLPYKLNTCAKLDHVVLQLDLYAPGTPSSAPTGTAQGVTAHETLRSAVGAADAGDQVRMWALTPGG